MYQKFKSLIRLLLEVLPLGPDLYLLLIGRRSGISYRKIFDTFGEAKLNVNPGIGDNYDAVLNRGKEEKIREGQELLDSWFHNHDYPLLFWASKLILKESRVLELGGSLGHFFYSAQKYTVFPENIKWTIAELPEAVELGRKVALDRDESRLDFIESDEISVVPGAQVFLSAGTLQYMEQHITEILSGLQVLPDHVLLHELPVHATKSFWTLQNLTKCEMPYRVYSEAELIESMVKLGYRLCAQWCHERSIEIPFYKAYKVDGYLGFYFTLGNENK